MWIPATVIDEVGDLKMTVYGDYPALLIHDGVVKEATWSAPGPTTMPRLLDSMGEAMSLVPGQIYIEVLPQGGRVTVGKKVWQH